MFEVFWKEVAPKGSFVDLVFRLVAFHQSLPSVNRFPAKIELSNEETVKFCDVQLLKMMKLLMKADSSSYMFVYDKYDTLEEFMNDIDVNINKMIELLGSKG